MRKIAGVLLATGIAFGTLAAPAWGSDKTLAKQLVVTQADVGNAYVASKSTGNNQSFSQIADCVGKPVTKRTVTARLDGSDLTNSQDNTSISSSVDFVKTTAMAKADQAVIADPKFADCVAQVAKDQGAAQGLTDITAQPVNVKHYGSFSRAVEAHVSGTSNGQPVQLTVIEVGILKGRAEVDASFITMSDQPFPQAQGEAILDKVNRRLSNAKV